MSKLSEALQTIKEECKKYKICADGVVDCPLYGESECMLQEDCPERWELEQIGE